MRRVVVVAVLLNGRHGVFVAALAEGHSDDGPLAARAVSDDRLVEVVCVGRPVVDDDDVMAGLGVDDRGVLGGATL
ncbi:MAG TPA: hypothetical protein VH482_38020 [Thermomicrobiales bacterium]|jgi:hypothetical protein